MDKPRQDEDLVAMVTGGSRGIGRATALKLAEAGYRVAVNYNKSKADAESLGVELRRLEATYLICQGDVSNWDDAARICGQVVESWGRIDLLVNNAGIIADALFHKMPREAWHQVIDVNLTGVFNCCRSCIQHMIEQKNGKIINISSFVGLAGNIGQANYAASKAGLVGFSKSLALELAKHGITVNVIAPGFIETEMLRRVPDEIRERLLRRIPLARFGNTTDVADGVLYLASASADYITGQVLSINGGVYL